MEPPVFVEDTCGLTRAFALLHKHNLTDLPVIDVENCLVGIASRVDIGTAMLRNWEIIFPEISMTTMIVSSVIFIVALTLIFTGENEPQYYRYSRRCVDGGNWDSAGILLTRRSCRSH